MDIDVSNNLLNAKYKVGDKVKVNYKGTRYIATITEVYYNDDSSDILVRISVFLY